MRQPQGLIALAALGCATPAPAPPAAPAPPPLQRWRLVGQVDDTGAGGLPFAGSGALRARCGERSPCVAELWRSDAGEELRLTRAGARYLREGAGERDWRARWTKLNGVLEACVGDPLQHPPASDPAARRELLTEGDAARWALSLTGQGRCRLSGELVLDAAVDRVDARGLACTPPGGAPLPWGTGGRECARDALIALLRDQAAQLWDTLPPEARPRLLQALAEDPANAALIQELRARD